MGENNEVADCFPCQTSKKIRKDEKARHVVNPRKAEASSADYDLILLLQRIAINLCFTCSPNVPLIWHGNAGQHSLDYYACRNQHGLSIEYEQQKP